MMTIRENDNLANDLRHDCVLQGTIRVNSPTQSVES